MGWFSTRLFYQQYNQNYILYSFKTFLQDPFFDDKRYFYDLGFENIFYIQFYYECDDESQITIQGQIENFRRNNVALSEYKSKVSPFTFRYATCNNKDLDTLILNMHILSSKTALKLMFLDSAIDSYFTLLFNCIILNYLTASSILNNADLKSFLKLFQAQTLNQTQESLANSRFNLSEILPAIHQIDLTEILLLADSNDLEICDEARDFVESCKEFKVKYSKSPQCEKYLSAYFKEADLLDNQSIVLMDLMQSNSNRIGILYCNITLCIDLTLNALK